MSKSLLRRISRCIPGLALLAVLQLCPPDAWAKGGRLVEVLVHGQALENTITGESASRHVTIYLPPGYDTEKGRRYPVLYLLHGIIDTDAIWTQGKGPWNSLQRVMDLGIARGYFGEMIVVMPNERTKWFGSFYTNSSVTGRWDDFTAFELVRYVDSHYRTLANAQSRGIAGHSMGGYGALKLAMRHPDVFSAVYAMNPALIGWARELLPGNPAYCTAAASKSFDDLAKEGEYPSGIVTVAQAFSPDPYRPPFYVDLPFKCVDGRTVPSEPGFSEWEANFLPNMVEANRTRLLRLRSLRFDSGTEDQYRFIPVEARELSRVLTANGIDHEFEEYNGDHRNRKWGERGRMSTEVLPFFSRLLVGVRPPSGSPHADEE